ncbi:tail fiber domain-containing protein [Pseudomonas fulva]|uniref:tail fiber domain-containing protein n=1 Tax=Pseudomonas fulva TaxID=47880 RepID=UPI00345CDFC8
MAYNSAHTGPEIDAAVQLLGQIQDARDSTSQDLGNVKELATQVKLDATAVSENSGSVTAKAAQVAQDAVAVERARQEVVSAAAAADEARDEASLSADSAKESQSAASTSEQAAASSQLAAGLSEQVSAESASEAKAAAEQVAADRDSAAASAAQAAASARDAEAVVTGGTASVVPGPGLIPIANGQGKIDAEWLSETIARTDSVQAAVDAAKQAVDIAEEAQARSARFIGPSPEAPDLRDDGTPLQIGDRYFNSVSQAEFIYKASGWAANESLQAIDDLKSEISVDAAVGGIPRADETGRLDINWLPVEIATDDDIQAARDDLDVSIGKKMDTSKLNGIEAFAYKKKIKAFPYKHPRYDEAVQRYGSIYPQAFCIDISAGEILFVSATGMITVFDWNTKAYIKTYNCALSLVSENAVIKYEQGRRILYLRGNGVLSAFNITNATQWQEIGAETSYPVNPQRNFAEHAGEWLITSDTVVPLSQNRSRGYFGVYDSSFNLKGNIYVSPLVCGINEGLPYEGSISKMQGMDYDGRYVYLGMGGFFNGSTENNERYGAYGVRKVTKDGKLVGDFLLSPKKLISKLNGYGFNATHCENEGVQFVKDTGKFYSLMVGATGSSDSAIAAKEGLYILEEFCQDADALDFSDCATVSSTLSEKYREIGLYPRYAGGLFNPLKGGAFASWPEVMDYMRSVDMSSFMYYSSTISLTDVNGAAVPSGYLINIRNCNNSVFRVEALGYNDELTWQIQGNTQVQLQGRPSINFTPKADNSITLGSASLRWSQIFSATSSISTSDERFKTHIGEISDKVLDAWADVDYVQYKFIDAVHNKGLQARVHFGVIAQRVKEAFENKGVDPFSFGILCYDTWEAEPSVFDVEGNEISPSKEAGEMYGIRYEEALALEAALVRRTTRLLEARLAKIERDL